MSEVTTPNPAQDTPKAGEGAGATPPVPPTQDAKAPAAGETAAAPPAEKKDAPLEKPVAPEKYDLKLPEGSLLKAERVEKISSYAKEKGLSNEQAQALLERENEAVSTYVQEQTETLNQRKEAWISQIQSDKEIGGNLMQETTVSAQRAIAAFGSDAFKKELNDSGLGNHPELVRVFARIGRAMADDKLVVPGPQGSTKKSLEELFYGEQPKS